MNMYLPSPFPSSHSLLFPLRLRSATAPLPQRTLDLPFSCKMEEVPEDRVQLVAPQEATEVPQRLELVSSQLLLLPRLLLEDPLPRRTSFPTWSACQSEVDLLVEASVVLLPTVPLLEPLGVEALVALLLQLLVVVVVEALVALLLQLLVVVVVVLQLLVVLELPSQ